MPPKARDIGPPARHRRAADHHDRDRGEQIFVADVERRTPEVAGQKGAAEAAECSAQPVGHQPDALDRDVGQPGRPGVLADCRDRAAEHRPVQHEPDRETDTITPSAISDTPPTWALVASAKPGGGLIWSPRP